MNAHGTGFSPHNAALYASLLILVPKPIGIITSIIKHPPRLWRIFGYRRYVGVVADLADRDEEAKGAAVGIGERIKLGVRTGLGLAD